MKKELKLSADLFRTDEIRIIEGQISGYEYLNILFKLYLVSLNNNGLLQTIDKTPFSVDDIAALVGFPKNLVEDALNLFTRLGLAKIWENQGIFFPYVCSNVIVTE